MDKLIEIEKELNVIYNTETSIVASLKQHPIALANGDTTAIENEKIIDLHRKDAMKSDTESLVVVYRLFELDYLQVIETREKIVQLFCDNELLPIFDKYLLIED